MAKPKRTNRTTGPSGKEVDNVASTPANLSGDDDPAGNPSGNEEKQGTLLVFIC